MRNVDSRIHSFRFDCCIFLFYSFSTVTFATQSASKRTRASKLESVGAISRYQRAEAQVGMPRSRFWSRDGGGVSHLSCNVRSGARTKVQGGLGEDARRPHHFGAGL